MELNLLHVEVIYLPPSTRSLIQPLDVCTIADLKCCYLCLKADRVLDLDELEKDDIYKVDILKANIWISTQWMTLPSAVIRNCWNHTSLISVTSRLEAEVEGQLQEKIRDLTSGVAEVVAE